MTMDLSKILFLDIETVPQHPRFDQADAPTRALWEEKMRSLARGENPPADFDYGRAGIYAEFGKIICICVGLIAHRGATRELRVKSFHGHDESALLQEFTSMLTKHFNEADQLLCAHNGKEFDYPYIIRRLIINRLEVPRILNLTNKKPWEIPHLDTMQMWKFGDYKSYTSLKLMAHSLGLPSPKVDIDGSQVNTVYWNENDLDRIVAYCRRDVVTLVQVYLRLSQQRELSADELEHLKLED